MNVIELTQRLVRTPSVTHEPNTHISQLMQVELESLGFEVREYPYQDRYGTDKITLAARRAGARTGKARGVAYFCHNDVVSVDGWNCPHAGPFDATLAEDKLWGRGACDMKGSAATALAAIAQIDPAQQQGPLYYFITGDEECGMAGAAMLSETSDFYAEAVERECVAIIGEPTELKLVNTHKGGCHILVHAIGKAAHSSTREGDNANWRLIPFLSYLHEVEQRTRTDQSLLNPAFDPAHLSLNCVLENHPAATNITVGKSSCSLFLRPMPDTGWESLVEEICERAQGFGLEVQLPPPLPPVQTSSQRPFVQETLQLLQQAEPLAVCYATDGCCFTDLADLIVLGPGSIEQAHRPDEWISLAQLEQGVQVLGSLFRRHCGLT